MSVGIVAQQGNDRAQAVATETAATLEADGVPVSIDAVTADELDRPGQPVSALASCDLVVSIGGDGTLLFVARSVDDTPIVGVNLGEVGFLNAVAPAEASSVVPSVYTDVKAGSHELQALPRVVATGANWTCGPALNELIVHAPHRGTRAGMSLAVHVDGEPFAKTTADGVMVATPTGSTAYNLSEQGPLVGPAVECLVINFLCPRDQTPPFVVPLDATVSIRCPQDNEALVIADGRSRRRVGDEDVVEITQAGTPVRIAGPRLAFLEGLAKLS